MAQGRCGTDIRTSRAAPSQLKTFVYSFRDLNMSLVQQKIADSNKKKNFDLWPVVFLDWCVWFGFDRIQFFGLS